MTIVGDRRRVRVEPRGTRAVGHADGHVRNVATATTAAAARTGGQEHGLSQSAAATSDPADQSIQRR